MTEPKHTPGPWTATQCRYHDTWLIEGGGDVVAYLYQISEQNGDALPCDNDAFNARLIASAPELLAALKGWHDLFCNSDMRPEDECHELFGITDALITKVEATQ